MNRFRCQSLPAGASAEHEPKPCKASEHTAQDHKNMQNRRNCSEFFEFFRFWSNFFRGFRV